MTVRRGAAGNAIVMFISSICNRSTARRKTYYNTKWMWGHRTLQPHITPHSELCNMKSTVPSPPSLILVKRRNSSPKHSNRGTGGHTPCAVTCRRTLLNNNSQEYIYDTLCWSRQSIQYTLNPLENPYQWRQRSDGASSATALKRTESEIWEQKPALEPHRSRESLSESHYGRGPDRQAWTCNVAQCAVHIPHLLVWTLQTDFPKSN